MTFDGADGRGDGPGDVVFGHGRLGRSLAGGLFGSVRHVHEAAEGVGQFVGKQALAAVGGATRLMDYLQGFARRVIDN